MNQIKKTFVALSALIMLSACGAVENVSQNVNREPTSTGVTLNENTNLPITTNPEQSEFLRNISLVADQPIETPLVITGEAKGWYFEGSFPIEIQDANGKVLITVPAQAKGDWMTESFVPFSATINFPKPTTNTGKVILRRDNPSGLPEYDMSYSIPVQFVGIQ